jgi:hypothetical protein
MMIPREMVADIGHCDPSLVGWPLYYAEAAVSVATSASCKDSLEDVRVLAIVMPKLKFGQIQRQIVFAHVVVRSDDSAFKQAPKRFEIVGMHFAAHVLMCLVVNVFVRKCLVQFLIASSLIGRNQADVRRYGLADKPRHGFGRSIFDYLTNHVALTGDRADDCGLARRATPFLLFVPVAIAVQATNVGFIYFNLAHQLREVFVLHRGSDALEHIPSCPIVAAADLAMNLKRADSFLGLAHQIDDLEPSLKRIVSILENRFRNDAEAIAVASAAFLGFANPMERSRLERIGLVAIAARTTHAIGPTHIAEQRLTGFLIRVIALQLGERDVRLSGRRLTGGNFVVHKEEYNNHAAECQAQHNTQYFRAADRTLSHTLSHI